MNNNPKKKRFKLLNPMRDGKGVEKGEDTTPTLKRFFKLWGRKFWRLVEVNLLIVVQVIPLIVCVFLYFTGPKVSTQNSMLYPALLGAQTAMPTTVGATLFNSASGLLHTSPIFNSWAHWVMAGLLLFQLITYGWQKVGTVYILRNMVRGDGVFMISDYFYAIKRNLKQGFFLGLIDCILLGTLTFNFVYYSSVEPSSFVNFMYVMTIALALIYSIMRFYTYLMLVTFDIKISKLFKNALIFTVLGIKRNIMALVGIALWIALFVLLSLVLVSFGIYAVLILPMIFFFGSAGFMYTYAAWPILERYMIAPTPAKAAADTPADGGADAPTEA